MWFQNSLFLSGSRPMPVLFPSLSTVPIQTNQTPTPQWQQQRLSWSQGSGRKRWQIYTALQHTHTHTHTHTQHRLTTASPRTLSGNELIETVIEREKVPFLQIRKPVSRERWPPALSSPLLSSPNLSSGPSGSRFPHKDPFHKTSKCTTLLPPMSFEKNRCLFHFQIQMSTFIGEERRGETVDY